MSDPDALYHAILDPKPSPKMDARGLVVGRCSCGYESRPTTEVGARAAAEGHYEAVMSGRWNWLVKCPYCAIKSVSNSRSGAFLMWFGHWADSVGDGQHPAVPEPPTEDMYEGIRLSKSFVAMMHR